MGKTMLEAAIIYLAAGNCSEKNLRLCLERDFSAIPELEKHLSITIKRLHQLHLINDQRIAYRIGERFSHKGNRFIVHQLQQQGIGRELIEKTLINIGSEYQRALVEIRTKLKQLPVGNEYDETTISRFLSGRHFSLATITTVLQYLHNSRSIVKNPLIATELFKSQQGNDLPTPIQPL